MVSMALTQRSPQKRSRAPGLNEMICFLYFMQLSAMSLVILWGEFGFWAGLPMALGIFTYGLSYFVVHDIFIHQRFKIFKKTNSKYAKGLRRAHKIHHKNIHKEDGECFGMLWVPLKYFK